MTVFGMFRVTPITEDDITEEVVTAIKTIEEYDVDYRTNSMATVVEADTVDELLAAIGAAHEAVPGDRVSTLVQIDDLRTKEMKACEKMDAVEDELGREARGTRD
ncbi:thiamine-binding protein [Halorussus halophilus]|uniref:thiamine-binding protein n=1 Tax=Halorussus halophilus TaxID=2650975 RepID=UPI00130128D5|nr:thiamine-binding protein [Halorussus halophilus]